jgi:hypothetical protein
VFSLLPYIPAILGILVIGRFLREKIDGGTTPRLTGMEQPA